MCSQKRSYFPKQLKLKSALQKSLRCQNVAIEHIISTVLIGQLVRTLNVAMSKLMHEFKT